MSGASLQPASLQAQAASASASHSDETPICTDRPTKSNVVCTVPAGDVQVEADLFVWTRSDDRGARVDGFTYSNPTLKFGVGRNADVQVNIAPFVEARTRAPDGAVERIGGVGDLFLRVKRRFTDPEARLRIGVIPFVKAPIARRGLGNGAWEGGLIAPIQYGLPAGLTLTLGPEIDLLRDADGRGRHPQYVGTVNLSKAVTSTVTAFGELWTAQNDDPGGHVAQYSADLAVTWLARPRLQLDGGVNVGLNRATPDAQLYLGVSTRF